MAATIRTFIGIHIPATPPLRAALQQMDHFGRSVKATLPENLHLTLKFLGDTPRTLLDEIRNALQQATENVPAHDIELTGLGTFPNLARPAVVWAGLRPVDHLKVIAARLDLLLKPLGYMPEARAFHPHLTLARVKGTAPGLPEVISKGRDLSLGVVPVSGVELYQSEPTPTGSRYTSLARVAFGKA